jgi:hypothetical protein
MHARPAILYSKNVHIPERKTENKKAIPTFFEMTLTRLSFAFSG